MVADFISSEAWLGFHLNVVKISSAFADFITVGDFIFSAVLFTFCRFYGIIQLIDKLEFDEWRFQSEKTIKKIIIKTACTRFDSFHKHNLLFSILSFYQAILHEEMSFFIIKSLFSYLCFGCCIDVCWIILIHRNRRNFTCVDGYCNELRFLQIL